MAAAFWRLALALAVTLAIPAAGLCQQVAGQVVDENGAPIQSAIVSLRPVDPKAEERRAVTDATGRFQFGSPSSGQFILSAQAGGFFRSPDLELTMSLEETRVTIVLHQFGQERQSIEVAGAAPTIDFAETAQTSAVHNEEIVAVPYPSTHSFRNALRLTPGATVQDASGEVHFNGGAAHQTSWSMDGFNVADPLTGRLQAPINVEAVPSATLSSGAYSSEFGKGAAGAMAIRTDMGSDRFRYAASNFVPGVELKNGLSLGDYRPRFKASGPLSRGRAWFSTSFDAEYAPTIVQELPRGENLTRSYGLSNLSRVQWNVTDSNILYAGALLSGANSESAGLGPLDPIQTTRDTRFRQRFLNVKNQKYFGAGLLFEAGYAHNRTLSHETPQGPHLLVFTPFGRTGNWFVDGSRSTDRYQWIANVLPPAFTWRGEHQIKAGLDLNALEYRQDIRRTGFERHGLEGELLRRVTFGGPGRFSQTNFEAAWFLQDSWRVRPGLLLELGLRRDWDELVGRWATSPRAGFAWGPGDEQNMKISGGFAVVRDATPLATFARGLDQFRLTETFDPTGGGRRGPLAMLFVVDQQQTFQSPQYRNWSLGAEKLFPGALLVKAAYLRRDGREGFTFIDTGARSLPLPSEPPEANAATEVEAIYALANAQRDRFEAIEMTVRKDFSHSRSLMVSYVRSTSRSNAALDISVETPSLVFDNEGPTPWDAPNRLVSWGHWPFNSKWTGAYMLEWRSGFPYSIEDLEGSIIGSANEHRLPDFLEANLSVERTFALFDRVWALRISAINFLDRRNPAVVNNTLGSPDFLTYSGGTSRAFVARIRWVAGR